MSAAFTESVIEQAALAWLESLGYRILSGLQIAPGEPAAERENYGQVVLEYRLRQALQRLNPVVPSDAIDEAFRKLTRPDSPSLVVNNHVLHQYLVEGVPVEYPRADGSIGGDLVRVLDYDEPENNEFLAVNQFTVVENQHERRPDVVLFVNGLPVAVIELKNAATENATLWSAFNQLQTYKTQIPALFAYNEALVVSDGVQARIGALTADREWFMPWRTIEGEELADPRLPQLQVVIEGVFEKRRFLDLIRHFMVFEDGGGGVLVKKMAGYHQYHAVNVAVMRERYEVCCGLFHRFDWSAWKTGGPPERLSLLPAAQEHVLAQDDGKNRLVQAVGELSKAFALAVPHEQALEIRDDVAFFQAVKSVLTKSASDGRRSPEEIEPAIRQIVSKAVSSEEVVDIFAAAGLRKPDISILSDEFLAEVRGMPQRNLAVEMLRKLLEGEIKSRGRKNLVQTRSFAELLEKAIKKYQNRAVETAQVIEELISLAKDLREAGRRGEKLGLTEDEVAFYDALEVNDSAVAVLGDEPPRLIAQELVKAVRNSITIDWTVRENVRAQMRVIIKRILRKYGYPPDKQAHATELVLEQAEVLCRDWTEDA